MTKAEQFIKDYTKGCSNELSAVEYSDGRKVTEYHEWLTPEQALRAVEIAREEILEKVAYWLRFKSGLINVAPNGNSRIVRDCINYLKDSTGG